MMIIIIIIIISIFKKDIEDNQIFVDRIWLLFHRVKWKIFIFHEWRSHE